jgi:hypothetical protein
MKTTIIGTKKGEIFVGQDKRRGYKSEILKTRDVWILVRSILRDIWKTTEYNENFYFSGDMPGPPHAHFLGG